MRGERPAPTCPRRGGEVRCHRAAAWRTKFPRMLGASEPESPFVGRERELDLLAAGLRDARAGRTRFVLVTGDAGIGKTRAVEELVRHAELPAGVGSRDEPGK